MTSCKLQLTTYDATSRELQLAIEQQTRRESENVERTELALHVPAWLRQVSRDSFNTGFSLVEHLLSNANHILYEMQRRSSRYTAPYIIKSI